MCSRPLSATSSPPASRVGSSRCCACGRRAASRCASPSPCSSVAACGAAPTRTRSSPCANRDRQPQGVRPMKFQRAALSAAHLWSSPFARWQGSLAEISSLDLAVAVTGDALAARDFDRGRVEQIVLGTTIPQHGSFYAAPWIAARLGMAGIGGPHIAQACATSVACIVAAATAVEVERGRSSLVVTADRTSNGPLLVYPRARSMGGSPVLENWVLDNFAANPYTGESMVATAEAVAREGGMSRQAIDELTLLRYRQYERALADDRAFQRRTLQPVA